ncbi:MAG: stage III sporulation protein AE [Blautia sp.]
MRREEKKIIRLLGILILGIVFLIGPVYGAENSAEKDILEQEKENMEQKLLEDMELDAMQDAVNELLGKDTFRLEDALEKILRGEKLFSREYFLGLLKEYGIGQIARERSSMIHMILLILLAALFTNFSQVFGSGQTGETSFFVVYMLLLSSVVSAFGGLGDYIKEILENFILFLKALMPSYFLAMTAASGSAGAMVFYEIALMLIYMVQMVFFRGVLPGIHVLVLMELVNHLHSEDFLSKMAELLRTVIDWTLRTCVAVIIGMQLIQNMISPAVDSLKRDLMGKAAGAIPGIGNAISGVTEVAIGTAVLIRNGIGVLGILVLLLIGIPPVIRLGISAFLYKLLAALMQPVSDKRMTGALTTAGDGCCLLLKVLLTVELLFLITIAILTVSFVSH